MTVYALKDDLDLARHKRDVSLELRDAFGRWVKRPGGAHLTLSKKDRFHPANDSASALAAHAKALIDDAQKAKPGTTEYEHKWAAVAAHLDAASEIAHKELAKAKPPKGTSKAVEKVTETGKDYGHEVVQRRGEAALISLGFHAASAVGGLLGAAEATHFTEAFNHLAENPLSEAAIAVIVTILIHALAVRIKKAITEHRDRRIKRARGEVTA